jgi:WD40-like Beta Propeller Repeat
VVRSVVVMAAAALVAAGADAGVSVRAPGRIFFSSNRASNLYPQLFRVGPDGGMRRQLTDPTVPVDDPSLSPDGTKIVYSSGREVRVHDLVGETDTVVVPADAGTKRLPTWSPDGRRIAYFEVSSDEYTSRLEVVDAAGSTRSMLGQADLASGLAWSPDADEIAYSRLAGASEELAAGGADGAVFGIATLVGLLAVSILIALVLVSGLGSEGERLGDRNVPYFSAIETASLAAKGVANDERGFLMTGEKRFVREANRRIEKARQAFLAASWSASDADEAAAARAASAGFERWLGALHQEFASFDVGRRAAIGAAPGPNRALRKRYEQSLSHAQALGAQGVKTATTSVDRTAEHSLTILLTCLGVALGLGTAIGVWLVRAILRPVYLLLELLSNPEPLREA